MNENDGGQRETCKHYIQGSRKQQNHKINDRDMHMIMQSKLTQRGPYIRRLGGSGPEGSTASSLRRSFHPTVEITSRLRAYTRPRRTQNRAGGPVSKQG